MMVLFVLHGFLIRSRPHACFQSVISSSTVCTNLGSETRLENLFGNPLVRGLVLPLTLGVAIGLLPVRGRWAGIIAVGLAMLAIYWMMEGLPQFPPLAAKQKLGYLILAGMLIGLALGTKSLQFPVAVGAGLLAALWLGIGRLTGSGDIWPLVMAFAVAALAGTGIALLPREVPDSASETPFLVPASVLLSAASGAIISVLGAFIGMAQVLGGFAALAGGYLLICFAFLLLKRAVPDLFAGGAAFAAGFAVIAALLVTALFAANAQPLALIFASLTFGMPFVYGRWVARRAPDIRLLRPFIAGAVVAFPALLAVLAAYWGSGSTAS